MALPHSFSKLTHNILISSNYVARRGLAKISDYNSLRGGAPKGSEEATNTSNISWVPDPVTGYYRPDTKTKDINPAQLRHKILIIKDNLNLKH